MEKPNLLLIGTGRWGSVIEKNLQALDTVGQVFTATRDWKEYLTRSDIAGVIIATPPATHAEIALAFIEKEVPVFIEKPMALSSTEAHRIMGASARAGVPVQIGHIHLYNDAFITLKELARSYGPLLHIVTEAANFGPYRPDYSVIWDYASHDVSMLLDMVEESPSRVTASAHALADKGSRNWDISHIDLLFPSGATAEITSSRVSSVKVRKVTVMCQKATLIFDDTLAEKKVAVYEHLTPASLRELGAKKATLEAVFPEYDSTSPLVRELQEFVNVITKKVVPLSDSLLGAQVVNVIEQAEASVTT